MGIEIGILSLDMEADEVVEEEPRPRRTSGVSLQRGHLWT